MTGESKQRPSSPLDALGVDAVAIKPTEFDVARVRAFPLDSVTIDYEGRSAVPDRDVLASLADTVTVRLTIPIRVDGFDPLGDDHLRSSLPDAIGQVLVAGHAAYLNSAERARAFSPRLAAALDDASNPWVGTEGVERVAMATGETQFDLLSATTLRDARCLEALNAECELAVYAPTVLTDDEDAILDAVGSYAARRSTVESELLADCALDSSASGPARESLLAACRSVALCGSPASVSTRLDALRTAGVDHLVAYPARGVERFFSAVNGHN